MIFVIVVTILLFPTTDSYDLVQSFNEDENSVEFHVVNGHTKTLEITIPENTIDHVYAIEVNGKIFDDNKRITLNKNKIFVDYVENIVTVKVLGSRDISGT